MNILLVALSTVEGYREVAHYARSPIGQDFYACPAIIVGAFLFSLISIWMARRDNLQRPTWSRVPWNWCYDPLQSLYITTWIMFAMATGGSLHLLSIGRNGFLTVSLYFSAALGFFLGQSYIYKRYHARITDA